MNPGWILAQRVPALTFSRENMRQVAITGVELDILDLKAPAVDYSL